MNKESIARDLFKVVESLTVEGIAILNSNGKYIYLNPRHAEMYGYTPDELIGKTWQILYSEENVKFIEENIMPKLFEQGRWEQILTGQKKDGTSISCRVALTILDEGLFCVCEDVTAKVQQKETEKYNMIQKVVGIIKGE